MGSWVDDIWVCHALSSESYDLEGVMDENLRGVGIHEGIR